MAFLATTLGAPALYIRSGVQYEKQFLTPDSGVYNFVSPNTNNWSFVNSLPYQNARIRGSYSLESNFEQGYFNFESWVGPVCYSTDGTKSGYYSLPFSGSRPPLANFWGIGETNLTRDALYNYGFAGTEPNLTPVFKNIGVACVMSGVDVGYSGYYPDLKIYIGSIPSGAVTIYGRVGSVNPSYIYNDKILSFDVVDTSGDITVTSGSVGPSYPSIASNDVTVGNQAWTSTSNLIASDGNVTSCQLADTTETSNYLIGKGFGFNVPSEAAIVGIQVVYYRKNGISFSTNNIRDFEIKLTSGGTIFTTNKAVASNWPTLTGYQTATYGGIADTWSRSWTPAEVNSPTFGAVMRVQCTDDSNPARAEVDYVQISVYYTITTINTSPAQEGSFILSNYDQGTSRRLSWYKSGFGDKKIIDMPNNRVTSRKFSNFLMTYSKVTGVGKFYTADDGEPMTLESIVNLGDISAAFNGVTKFYEDSFINSYLEPVGNPKIITDYGISNREWNDNDISLFDNHRLNGAYWINDFSSSNPPSPSGNDGSSLTFHFPPKSSGLLGSCKFWNNISTDYYVPLSSGINSSLLEFDRSNFNPYALSVDMWVSNTGTNPSGNLGMRIDFCSQYDYFLRPLFATLHSWSGYPIQIPSGISLVRMSGVMFNAAGGLSDLSEVTRNEANTAGMYLGAWYNDIGVEYQGDIKVHSVGVSLDGYVFPTKASGNLPLYCAGQPIANSNIPLYLRNEITYSSLDLFTGGHGIASGQLNFFISGSTAYGNIPLYIKGEGTAQSNSGNISLYTQGPLFATSNAGMNLFLKNDADKVDGHVDLFCANYFAGASGQFNLFLQGASSIPASASMNLFLNRPTESVAHNMPLFIGAPEPSNMNMDLFIKGGNISSNQIPLFIDGVGHSNSTLRLYTHGF